MLWKDQKLKYINAKKINYILLSYIIYKYYYAFTCNTVMYLYLLVTYMLCTKRMFNRYDALLWSQYSAQ